VQGLPDPKQEIDLEARLPWSEGGISLDLDYVATDPLGTALATSNEIDAVVGEARVAQPDSNGVAGCRRPRRGRLL